MRMTIDDQGSFADTTIIARESTDSAIRVSSLSGSRILDVRATIELELKAKLIIGARSEKRILFLRVL